MDSFLEVAGRLHESVIQDPLFLIAVNLFVATFVRLLKPNVLTGALLGMVLIISSGYLGTQHGSELMQRYRDGRRWMSAWASLPRNWPPQVGMAYPDLELLDQDGKLTRLSEFRGKVLLIEPVGMPCPACIAFSGGHRLGAFDGVTPQSNLKSIDQYVRRYAHVRPDDDRLVHVQLLLFNQKRKAPTAEDAREWANHFRLRRSDNRVVLVGTRAMATPESRAMIPGFHLVDKDFVLRADSTGNPPQDDLFRKLLPLLRKTLHEG